MESMTTKSFLYAFQRLAATYGTPEFMSSDNQACYHSAANWFAQMPQELIQEEYEPDSIKKHCPNGKVEDCEGIKLIKRNIYPTTWKFNPAGASHRNETEIFVKSMKMGLYKATNFRRMPHPTVENRGIYYLPVTHVGLQTLIDTILTCINDRALGPSATNDAVMITPSRLLLGRTLWHLGANFLEDPTCPKDTSQKPDIRLLHKERIQLLQTFAEEFRTQQHQEFRHFWKWNKDPITDIKVGKWVMTPPTKLIDTRKYRHLYIPAIIVKVEKSHDGYPRQVTVRIPGKKTGSGHESNRLFRTFAANQVTPLRHQDKTTKVRFARHSHQASYLETTPTSEMRQYIPPQKTKSQKNEENKENENKKYKTVTKITKKEEHKTKRKQYETPGKTPRIEEIETTFNDPHESFEEQPHTTYMTRSGRISKPPNRYIAK